MNGNITYSSFPVRRITYVDINISIFVIKINFISTYKANRFFIIYNYIIKIFIIPTFSLKPFIMTIQASVFLRCMDIVSWFCILINACSITKEVNG